MDCFHLLDPAEPLSQGDLVVWPNETDYMARAAVVVTADCDLARGKHWGRVSVVPLIAANHYFEQLYIPKLLERMGEDLLGIFGEAVRKSMPHSEKQSPSVDALETLISSDALPHPICLSADAVRVHSVIRRSRNLDNTVSAADTLDQAIILRSPQATKLSSSKIENFLSSPPGDCMILPPIKEVGPEMHIAFLRILREVKEEEIAFKNSQLKENNGQRIGRLIPVVRYRLTQMLGQVFSDIGLPDQYESELKVQKKDFVISMQNRNRGVS